MSPMLWAAALTGVLMVAWGASAMGPVGFDRNRSLTPNRSGKF